MKKGLKQNRYPSMTPPTTGMNERPDEEGIETPLGVIASAPLFE